MKPTYSLNDGCKYMIIHSPGLTLVIPLQMLVKAPSNSCGWQHPRYPVKFAGLQGGCTNRLGTGLVPPDHFNDGNQQVSSDTIIACAFNKFYFSNSHDAHNFWNAAIYGCL